MFDPDVFDASIFNTEEIAIRRTVMGARPPQQSYSRPTQFSGRRPANVSRGTRWG